MEDIIIDEQEPNISITSDDIDVVVSDEYSTDYNLPIASDDTLGGVKIGDNVDIASDGTISIPIATDETLGVVKAGTNITIASDGTISAASVTPYVLPQATNVTLGGVYVDTTLSSVSQNPVQNKIINSNLNTLSNSVTSLQGTVESQGDVISNAVGAISDLQDADIEIQADISDLDETVTQHTQDISTNASNIGANTTDIVSLKSRMTNAEGNITSITNATSEMAGSIADLSSTIDTTYTYEDIDDTIWSSGDIRIEGQGRIEFAYINLEGSLTLADNTPYTVLTIDESAILPQYESISILNTDAGIVECIIDTSGNIKIINNSGSSITITRIYGCVPMVVAYGLSE